ncbi:MAG: exodeoxyribonuclease VII small subunit [Cyanobium sp.]
MPKAKPSPARKDDKAPANSAADLSYNEAHTALQLTLASLQANDLDVEEMTGLYRQARTYLERCEAVLAHVEQEILLWEEVPKRAVQAESQQSEDHLSDTP